MFVKGQQEFFNLDFEGMLWKRSLIIWHLNLLWYIKVSRIICWLFSQTQRTKIFLFVSETLYLWKLNLYCSQLLFQSHTLFFTLYSCFASSTSISFFSHFLSLFFWIFNKVNIQFRGFRKLRDWDYRYLSMDFNLHFPYTCMKVTFHLSVTDNPGWL